MQLATTTMPRPLREDADGVLRIGSTRVTLQTLVAAFRQGSTAEEIALRYPVLSLEQVYSTIGFYLHHEAELRAYLADERAASERERTEAERRPEVARVRDRIRERQARR